MAHCHSPYQLFINPDCLVDPLSIGEMIGTLELNPHAGMAGPLLVNTDGSEQAGGAARGCRHPGAHSCAPSGCPASVTAIRACFPTS
jgi:GT2 family glycosyltransferase